MVEQTFAAQLFEARYRYESIKSVAFEKTLEILGFSDLENIPFEDYIIDPYDNSFELLDVRNGFEVTPEQQQKFWELGFYRFWLNYHDGTGKYYYYPLVVNLG